MTRYDREYFRERAVTERILAQAASHRRAIAAHTEMAERYEALVRDGRPSSVVQMIRKSARTRRAA